MAVHMGYMGSAKIGNTNVYLTGCTLNPVQNLNAPDLIQGKHVKHIYNWDKIEIGGNLSGPIITNMGTIWDGAYRRSAEKDEPSQKYDVSISYYKGGGRRFNGCFINTMEVSVTAGDVSQFSIDFFGTATGSTAGGAAWSGANCTRLVTWDQCTASVDGASGDVQAFSVTCNNNLERIYKLNQSNMYPAFVKAGFREVTGSITVYAEGDPGNGHAQDSSCNVRDGTFSFNFGCAGSSAISGGGTCVTHRSEASGSIGPALYTYNFTQVCVDD